MTLDFNTPTCWYREHRGKAIPAVFQLEDEYGTIAYLCDKHPRLIHVFDTNPRWTVTRINQHTQPTHTKG